jgi:ArsR family transcriptional regulator
MKRSPVFGRLAALSDPIRARLLAALERNELTVGELHRALQLPQSTVSRHLRALADAGWVSSREDGTSNLYRMAPADRGTSARKLWHAVRDDVTALAGGRADAERVRRVLAERHGTSQKFFASSAGQWDRLRAELVGDRTELVALSALLDRSWTVADLGCGSGQLAEAVAPFVERVIGVDESPTMLRAARARLAGHRNVELRQGALEKLPLDAGEAHCATLSLVLQYIADPPALLGAVRRALRAHGRLVIVDFVPHDRADLRERLGTAWQGFGESQLAGWARDAGFSTTSYTRVPPHPTATGPSLFVAALTV